MSLKKIIPLFVLQLGRRVLFGGVGFPYSWVSDSMDSILLAHLHKCRKCEEGLPQNSVSYLYCHLQPAKYIPDQRRTDNWDLSALSPSWLNLSQ